MRWSPQGRMSDGGHTPHPGACVCRPFYGNSTERNWGAILTHLPQVLSVGVWTRAPPALALCGRSCAVLKSTADLQSGHRRASSPRRKWCFLWDATGCYRAELASPSKHIDLSNLTWSWVTLALPYQSKLHDSFSKGIRKSVFFHENFTTTNKNHRKNPANKNPIPTKTTTPHHRRPLHLPSRSCYKNYGPTVKERPKIGRAWAHLMCVPFPFFFDNSYPP